MEDTGIGLWTQNWSVREEGHFQAVPVDGRLQVPRGLCAAVLTSGRQACLVVVIIICYNHKNWD